MKSVKKAIYFLKRNCNAWKNNFCMCFRKRDRGDKNMRLFYKF